MKSWKKLLHKTFEIGVIAKAFFGFFEMMGGILFAFSGKILVDNFIIDMAQQEIAEDPNDPVANFIINSANNIFLDSRIFAVAYLLFHGAVNIFLAISLIKGKLKAYPLAIGLFSIFLIYQVYKYFHSFSPAILALTLFDIIFMGLIWLEYKRKAAGSRITGTKV